MSGQIRQGVGARDVWTEQLRTAAVDHYRRANIQSAAPHEIVRFDLSTSQPIDSISAISLHEKDVQMEDAPSQHACCDAAVVKHTAQIEIMESQHDHAFIRGRTSPPDLPPCQEAGSRFSDQGTVVLKHRSTHADREDIRHLNLPPANLESDLNGTQFSAQPATSECTQTSSNHLAVTQCSSYGTRFADHQTHQQPCLSHVEPPDTLLDGVGPDIAVCPENLQRRVAQWASKVAQHSGETVSSQPMNGPQTREHDNSALHATGARLLSQNEEWPVVKVSVDAEGIYIAQKARATTRRLYAGKPRLHQLAQPVWDEWNACVRDRLATDLKAARTSSKAPRRESLVIEAYPILTGTEVDRERQVSLKPTIWIWCNGKSCRKVIRESVACLSYLSRFRVEVHSDAPIFASGLGGCAGDPLWDYLAGDRTEYAASGVQGAAMPYMERICKAGQGVEDYSLPNTERPPSIISACGLRLDSPSAYPELEADCMSTVGGIVQIGHERWGVTTAHGLIAHEGSCREGEASGVGSNVDSSSSDGESSSVGSVSEISEPKGSKLPSYPASGLDTDTSMTGTGPEDQPASPLAGTRRPRFTTSDLGTYLFDYYSPGSRHRDVPAQLDSCDFALVSIAKTHLDGNFYVDSTTGELIELSRAVREEEATEGDAWILVDAQAPQYCFILPGTALLLGGERASMKSRKLALHKVLPKAASGAWVVQQDKVCGVIVARHDVSLEAHMIPIATVLSDISLVYGKPTRIATQPLFPCPFSFLQCKLAFNFESQWRAHASTHVTTSGLPSVVRCAFQGCRGLRHSFNPGAVSWSALMDHMAEHHRFGQQCLLLNNQQVSRVVDRARADKNTPPATLQAVQKGEAALSKMRAADRAIHAAPALNQKSEAALNFAVVASLDAPARYLFETLDRMAQ